MPLLSATSETLKENLHRLQCQSYATSYLTVTEAYTFSLTESLYSFW